ncbi:glycosyltransferase family 4 protein [Aureimonas psammosilenae]|uniref:glycosyltransferase family 4 protein n=1 Tax=Aureimonas psammosilenae TaxID=2495496 RepID=UPI001F3B850A|nr:glycosyltransferase family 4 protein [Aureimonas psammosilenae]
MTERPSIVVIGDLVEGWPPHGLTEPPHEEPDLGEHLPGAFGRGHRMLQAEREAVAVTGGYLERLPLAMVRAGWADHAEIWHHARSLHVPPAKAETPWLTRRVFRLDEERAPFASTHMLRFIEAFGAPHILVVLGLGVDEAVLAACSRSFRIYNSIDAPALRVPNEVGRHFDLVLTGAQWQSDEVEARLPGTATAIMPIGPEFADPETFRPLGGEKRYDVVYVAAAQKYKRHDILFDALADAPRRLKCLCVFGYGEMGEELRREAASRDLDVEFVGPPGVSFAEVNTLMNQARVGVVCGVDDGAPAILTEYMLAGLPVLANEKLSCGLQFITSETGRTASAEDFGAALVATLNDIDTFQPRQAVLERWIWPKTAERLAALLPPRFAAARQAEAP